MKSILFKDFYRNYSLSLIRLFLFIILQDLHIAARQIKLQYPNVIIEASGGITESNIHKYFGSDIDIISLSRISQGYSVVDFL